MKIFITFFLAISVLTCRIKPGKYTFNELIETQSKLNINKENAFYLNANLIKKVYPDLKFSINNSVIEIVNNDIKFLKVNTEECSVGNLSKVKKFTELKLDTTKNLNNLLLYPKLIEKIRRKKFTLLFYWSNIYPLKTNKKDIDFAKNELKNKCDDCQILFLNSDIYKELLANLKND